MPGFELAFPDSLAVPSENFSYLNHKTGVGIDQDCFACGSVAEFRQSFEGKVAPALHEHAIPYLSSIATLADLAPLVRNAFYSAVIRFRIGDKRASVPLLEQELRRIEALGAQTDKVLARIAYIKSLLVPWKQKRL